MSESSIFGARFINCVNISIIDDETPESNETFRIVLHTLSVVDLCPVTAVIMIDDSADNAGI